MLKSNKNINKHTLRVRTHRLNISALKQTKVINKLTNKGLLNGQVLIVCFIVLYGMSFKSLVNVINLLR